jgi:hypothetical protein
MSVDSIRNELAPEGPAHLAFKLALARGNAINQLTVATIFCYLVGAHIAQSLIGDETDNTIDAMARQVCRECSLFSDDTIEYASKSIMAVVKHLRAYASGNPVATAAYVSHDLNASPETSRENILA